MDQCGMDHGYTEYSFLKAVFSHFFFLLFLHRGGGERGATGKRVTGLRDSTET